MCVRACGYVCVRACASFAYACVKMVAEGMLSRCKRGVIVNIRLRLVVAYSFFEPSFDLCI